MDTFRHYSLADSVCLALQKALSRWPEQSVQPSQRPSPAEGLAEDELTPSEKQHACGLMRVNHSGEVCAQALYSGQSFTARSKDLQSALKQAASEEEDHLAWCKHRVEQLGGKTSVFDPVWYAGSWVIGAVAGACGDAINLGFLAETEHQVGAHLQRHLGRLPASDKASRAIIEQMREDEAAHENLAHDLGGKSLPAWVKRKMRIISKIMTSVAYHI